MRTRTPVSAAPSAFLTRPRSVAAGALACGWFVSGAFPCFVGSAGNALASGSKRNPEKIAAFCANSQVARRRAGIRFSEFGMNARKRAVEHDSSAWEFRLKFLATAAVRCRNKCQTHGHPATGHSRLPARTNAPRDANSGNIHDDSFNRQELLASRDFPRKPQTIMLTHVQIHPQRIGRLVEAGIDGSAYAGLAVFVPQHCFRRTKLDCRRCPPHGGCSSLISQ